MKLKELENTITCLPPEELARFREWFMEFDAEQFDRRIQGDADNGRLETPCRNGAALWSGLSHWAFNQITANTQLRPGSLAED